METDWNNDQMISSSRAGAWAPLPGDEPMLLDTAATGTIVYPGVVENGTTLSRVEADGIDWIRGALPRLRNNGTTLPRVEADGIDWIREALLRLRSVADLPDDWDGEGSCGTDPIIVGEAIRLLLGLEESVRPDIPPPDVFPIRGGSFQLEWTSEERHIEIEFLGSSRIAYLKEESGDIVGSEEIDTRDREVIRELIEWFATPRG